MGKLKNRIKAVSAVGLALLLAACSGGSKYEKAEYKNQDGYRVNIEHDEKYAYKISSFKPFKQTNAYALLDDDFRVLRDEIFRDTGISEDSDVSTDNLNEKEKKVLEELSKLRETLSNKKEDVKKLFELYMEFSTEKFKEQLGGAKGFDYEPSVDEEWAGVILNINLEEASDELLENLKLGIKREDGKVLFSSLDNFFKDLGYTKK